MRHLHRWMEFVHPPLLRCPSHLSGAAPTGCLLVGGAPSISSQAGCLLVGVPTKSAPRVPLRLASAGICERAPLRERVYSKIVQSSLVCGSSLITRAGRGVHKIRRGAPIYGTLFIARTHVRVRYRTQIHPWGGSSDPQVKVHGPKVNGPYGEDIFKKLHMPDSSLWCLAAPEIWPRAPCCWEAPS